MSLDVSIDWEAVNWGYVALLSAFTFIASLIANLVTFGHRLAAAILSTLLFAMIFIAATYYPHNISLPTLTSSDAPKARPLPDALATSIRRCAKSAPLADALTASIRRCAGTCFQMASVAELEAGLISGRTKAAADEV